MEGHLKKELQHQVSIQLQGLEDADVAAQDLLHTAGESKTKLLVPLLTEEMLKESSHTALSDVGGKPFESSEAADRSGGYHEGSMGGQGGAPEEHSKRASDLLLSLAKGHFHEVMGYLQNILKEVDTPPHPMLLKTLENFSSRYALRTVPYIISSFLYLQVILILDLGSREKVAICSGKVLRGQAFTFVLFFHSCGENVSEAALKARWPMLAVLVRYQPQQDEILRKFPDVIKESRMVDAPLMAKGLYLFLEGCVDCHPPNLKKIFRTLEKSTFSKAREATLFFLKELLSSLKVEGCLEWEMVTYLFRQVAVRTSQGGRFLGDGSGFLTLLFLWFLCVCVRQVRDSARGLMPREADVQDLSIEVLEHVNTSATGMFKALWPKLLSFLLPPEYTPALTPLCRCLKELAVLRPEGSVLFLGSCRGVKLPSPQEVFGRLLVLSSSGSQRGFWALQLLHALRADIHEAIVHLWAQQIPALWGYCQAEGTRGSQPEWQQKLLQFLRRSLKTMEDDTWTKNLILALEDQMGSYADGSLEKSVLYQVLGLSLACCSDRTYVLHWLERLIESANYLEAAEKEKVAEILSFAALDHLDLTLATLDDCGAGIDFKMGLSALLTHHKDYKTGRRGHLLKTLILAYGRVAIRAPKELLLKSGEAEILKKVLDLYRMSFQVLGVKIESQARQDTHLKLLFCESVANICKAISEAQDGNFQLGCKKELLEALLLMYTRSVEARGKLFEVLVTEEPTSERIEVMFQLIEPWFLECEGSRERALQASFQVLAPFQASFRLPDGENFKGYGFAVAFLAPYILENSIACRQWAAKCINCLIHIQGGSRITEAEEKEMTSALCDLQAEVPTDLSGAWARLAKVVSIHLAKDQLLDFTEAILEDLVSGIPSCARAGGYWLLANLQNHGEAMKSKVPELLDTFCSHLPIVTQGGMEEVPLEAVCIMARSHLDTVLGHLLRRSLPLDSETGKLWRSFDRDPSLAVRVLAKLMSCVNQPSILGSTTSSSIDESGDYAEEEPLKATCAIYEVLSGLPSEVGLQKVFPELLFTLLWQVSQTLGQKMPPCEGRRRLFLREQHLTPGNPCSLSVDTLKALVVKGTPTASQEEIKTADFWSFLGDPRTHPEGLCQLTKCLLENGLLKDQVIQDVLPWMDASSEKLRLAGTALFTEVIQEPSFTRWAALRAFVPTLIRNMEDQNAGIRRMALRSLGRLLLMAPDQRALGKDEGLREGPGLVSSFQVKGLKKDLLILLFNHLRDSAAVDEALEALALVVPCLRMGKVAFLFRDLCWRASKYLSEEDDAIRAAAFHLFGALATRAKQGYKTFFANLVKENLALLLIYQGDPNPNISEVRLEH
ncbi:maestro heat-like repeat-containing protein family member 2B [Pogona vitticeps]